MESAQMYFKYKKVRNLCLKNAEDFVNAAKQVSGQSLQHIQYHIATLALEEIGKAELIEMSFVAGMNERDTTFGESSMENHVRKLFWAFWGPAFGKKIIAKQEIEQIQGLATNIHRRRLDTLYVKPSDTKQPKLRLTQKEADQITSMAEARLEMEKLKTMLKPDDPKINKEELNWFLKSTSDPEKFSLIFGRKAQEKLIEIGDVRDWIHWLKKQFDENDDEIRKIIEEERSREKPTGAEAKKPKYKIKVKINSESHSIRNKELKKWNEVNDFLKLYSDDKNNLICDFFLPKSTHIQATWFIGWGMARTFVTSLNIATKGFFWWHIPKDRSRFYEDMWDLERNMKMGVEQRPELSVNFKDLHWVLKEADLGRVSMIFYYITKVKGKKEETPFAEYINGCAFVAKNDIHLRFELNAFAQFFLALKKAFHISGDWDGKSDFKKAVHEQFSKMDDFENIDIYLQLGEELQLSPDKKPAKEITLTDVFGMKLLADIYLERLAKRAIDTWKKEKAIKRKE